jgi:hypothetical protein
MFGLCTDSRRVLQRNPSQVGLLWQRWTVNDPNRKVKSHGHWLVNDFWWPANWPWLWLVPEVMGYLVSPFHMRQFWSPCLVTAVQTVCAPCLLLHGPLCLLEDAWLWSELLYIYHQTSRPYIPPAVIPQATMNNLLRVNASTYGAQIHATLNLCGTVVVECYSHQVLSLSRWVRELWALITDRLIVLSSTMSNRGETSSTHWS